MYWSQIKLSREVRLTAYSDLLKAIRRTVVYKALVSLGTGCWLQPVAGSPLGTLEMRRYGRFHCPKSRTG